MRHSLLTAATIIFGVASTAIAQAPSLGPAKARPAVKAPASGPAVAGVSTKMIEMIGPNLIKADGTSVETAKVLAGKKNVVLYFTASWCGPCRRFTPELVKFADQNLDAKDFVLVHEDRFLEDVLQAFSADLGDDCSHSRGQAGQDETRTLS